MASLAAHLPSFLLTCLIFFIFSNSVSAASAEKVKVGLYYETLCPACSNFMANKLPKVFQNKLIDIMDLHLVPYGNARLGGPNNETITCQHGTYECSLNTVEACAIHVWPDVKTHYGFVHCIESLVHVGNYTEWEHCFDVLGLESKAVMDCYHGTKGKQLELQYAKETDNLQPPHEYVPWLTVNKQPLGDNYEDFMTFICKAYKGDHAPDACSDLRPLQVISTRKNQNRIPHVCHVDVKTASTSPDKPPVA